MFSSFVNFVGLEEEVVLAYGVVTGVSDLIVVEVDEVGFCV